MTTEPDSSTSLRAALEPSALRAALIPHRPVFANPWDSEPDMFACIVAVSLAIPLLLFVGGKLMGDIFGFSSHWRLGLFMAGAIVGAGGFMTIVGRERTSLSVDVLAITGWVILGLVVAPIVGLAPPIGVAIAVYAVMLLATFLYVLRFGRWQAAFASSVSWPMTWSALAVFFAFCAYRLILYQ
jgi:hypothetical protein